MKKEIIMNTRGRKNTFEKKMNIVNTMQNLEETSRFLKERLIQMGYLEKVTIKNETKTRGRVPVTYVITGKGKGLLGMSKNWIKKSVVQTETEAVQQNV